jgi:hypothetical protein
MYPVKLREIEYDIAYIIYNCLPPNSEFSTADQSLSTREKLIKQLIMNKK